MSSSLKRERYALDWAADGVAAAAALSTADYDLIILDLGLRKLSGLNVLKQLRGRGESQRALPVLVAIVMDAVSDRVEGLDAGAGDYLVKPFALDELHARVRALIWRRNAAGSLKSHLDERGADDLRLLPE